MRFNIMSERSQSAGAKSVRARKCVWYNYYCNCVRSPTVSYGVYVSLRSPYRYFIGHLPAVSEQCSGEFLNSP
jgi:hypothetical protein